ncbi:unnamed protein product [Schistosoma curassoni]|uniref:NTR domain-containing protein n=1 Tax=Schistosoma curassoni TaxID=6186 RepID=A0A183K8V8_9TREM|nr:unnamed protein product [Schistosoma curassoni]
MNYPEGSEVRQSEDELTLTKQIDVQMKGLKNKNARATYLTKSNRSVKLNAYIQAVTYPSTRAIIGFRFRYSQADVIIRELQVPIIANYRNFINVSNPTFNFSGISSPAKVETFAEVYFSLRLPPSSKQIYAVEIGFDNVSLGEFCYSTITEVGKGITNRITGMRLYTEYMTQKLTMLRRMAVINLGVLENPSANNTEYYVNFKIIVRPCIDRAFPTISETQINARVFITGTPQQQQQSVAFSVVDEPILPITANNSPNVNLYKTEPALSEPMDAYNGILFAEISWVEQVIYSPVKILFSITSSQLPYWAIDSLATSRNNNSVVRGAFNLLSFSMIICSGARQTYSAQLYILQITNIVTFMKTKTIVFGRSISKCGTSSTIVNANTVNLNMASQYFDSE